MSAEDFLKTLGLRIFTYRFYENPKAVQTWLERVLANPYPQSVEAFMRQAGAVLGHDATGRLGSVRVLTHVISGDEDLFLPARLSRVLAERIPGARATVIAGGAHALHVEKPAEFNRAVLEFIGGAA